MPQVELTQKDDETLERLAPAYLKGKNNASSRVAWAVTLLEYRAEQDANEAHERKAPRLCDERVGNPDRKNTAYGEPTAEESK
jgi:hypothetical protein